jgi:hypothetical protein
MIAVLADELRDDVPQRLIAELAVRPSVRKRVAQQQRKLLDGRIGREGHVREGAVVDDQSASLCAPLDLIPGRCGHGGLDASALAEEVDALVPVEVTEQERRIFGEPACKTLGACPVLALGRRRVAVRLVQQLRQRVRLQRSGGVAQQQRKASPIDGKQRLVLSLLATSVAFTGARGVPQHAPGAQKVESVRECNSLDALAEVDDDLRLNVRAGALHLPREVGDRRLRATALERHEREQQQQAATIAERRPLVARPLAPADGARPDAKRPAQAIDRRRPKGPRGGAADLELIAVG